MKENNKLQKVIFRIQQMEYVYDTLQYAADNHPDSIKMDPILREMLASLIFYYDNGLWMRDYTYDEKGMLPSNLKRGVLSEDGVYNLLCQIHDIQQSPENPK